MVRCGDCGQELSPEFAGTPCPACQSTSRNFSLLAGTGSFSITGGSASLVHARPGLQSAAQADDQGAITLTVSGPSPKNEDDALDICARLVRALNAEGANWSAPVVGKQDVDALSTNAEHGELQMQVVRASNNKQLWQQVNIAGEARIEGDARAFALELIEGIRKKAEKYPSGQKAQLLLVLDAARTPSHTFQQVLDAFQSQHLKECQEAGFVQVWVVGPQDSLVVRLDRETAGDRV